MFDPLDRPVPNEDDNQATSRDDFLQKLQDLKPTHGIFLHVPLNNYYHKLLIRMLDNGRNLCLEQAQRYMERARDEGMQFADSIQDDQIIEKYRDQLRFLAEC